MVNGIEKELLKEFAKKSVMRKDEIIKFLDGKVNNPIEAYKEITNNLVSNGLITYVYVGESTFVLTRKGIDVAMRL